MTFRIIAFAGLFFIPCWPAQAQIRPAIQGADGGETDCEPIYTLEELLTGAVTSQAVLDSLSVVGKGDCVEEIEGHFIFCVQTPCEVTVPKEDFEWRTCLVYDEATCCHKWVKYKEPKILTVKQIRLKEVKYCVKLAVPVSDVLNASRCDCEKLPGTNLQFITSNAADVTKLDMIASKEDASEGGDSEARKGVATQALSERTVLTGAFKNAPSDRELGQVLHFRKDENRSRPGSILELSHRGSETIHIEKLQFEPQEVIKATPEDHVEFWGRARTSKAATILLDESHNKGRSGLHGSYKFVGENDLSFGPDAREAALTIAIDDSEHFGWGFSGQLTLTASDGSQLVVPDYQVLFVRASEEG